MIAGVQGVHAVDCLRDHLDVVDVLEDCWDWQAGTLRGRALTQIQVS